MSETDFIDDTPGPAPLPPIIADRSTLERVEICPRQQAYVAAKKRNPTGEYQRISTSSTPAEVGTYVHHVIATVIKERFERGIQSKEMRDMMLSMAEVPELEGILRPDLQLPVVQTLTGGTVYRIVDFLTRHEDTGAERHAEDMWKFQGGEGNRSGQIAWDIMPATGERGPVRLTCELDLALPTASETHVRIIDTKSGWKNFSATTVRYNFQLGNFYPFVLATNFSAVRRIDIQVLIARHGTLTSPVTFDVHRDMPKAGKRIELAVLNHLKYREETDPEKVPALPSEEKCRICPAVLICRGGHEPTATTARDPKAALRRMDQLQNDIGHLEAQSAAIANILKAVTRDGDDLDIGDVCFGTRWPRRTAPREVAKMYHPRQAPDRQPGDDEMDAALGVGAQLEPPAPVPVLDPGADQMTAAIDASSEELWVCQCGRGNLQSDKRCTECLRVGMIGKSGKIACSAPDADQPPLIGVLGTDNVFTGSLSATINAATDPPVENSMVPAEISKPKRGRPRKSPPATQATAYCQMCSGEYCAIHFAGPCECDTAERHTGAVCGMKPTPTQETPESTGASERASMILLTICDLPWAGFIIAWAQFAARDPMDVARIANRIALRLGRKGNEETISRETRRQWVEAGEPGGALDWATGELRNTLGAGKKVK